MKKTLRICRAWTKVKNIIHNREGGVPPYGKASSLRCGVFSYPTQRGQNGSTLGPRDALIFSLLLTILLFSCATTGGVSGSSSGSKASDTAETNARGSTEVLLPPVDQIEWKEVHDGIRMFSYSKTRWTPAKQTRSKNGRLQYTVVEMDLEKLSTYPYNLSFTAKRPSESGYWADSETVKGFAKRTDSFIAVNTNPFHQKQKKNPFTKGHILGLCIENGKMLSEPNEKYAALTFYREGKTASDTKNATSAQQTSASTPEGTLRAKILNHQTEIYDLPALPENACGGFYTVLEDGIIKEFKTTWDTRCAAGTKDGGKKLILFAGEPLSFMETAEILKSLGAEKAMQLDGGNSTALVVNEKLFPYIIIRCQVVSIMGMKILRRN